MNTLWKRGEPFMFIPRSDNPDPQNPKNYFMLLDLTAAIKPQNRQQTRDALNYQERTAPSSGFLDTIYEDITEKKRTGTTAEDILRAAQKAPRDLTGNNYARSEFSISIVDDRRNNNAYWLKNIYAPGTEFQNIPPQYDHYVEEFVRHHEAAHNMLVLKEHGSDFIAAATLLKKDDSPESREALQILADHRTLQGGDEYGIHCAMAIEAALRLPPEQIQNASAQEIYELGAGLDKFGQMVTETRNAAQMLPPPPANADMTLGFDDFKDFMKQSWNEVSKGRVPNFSRIYDNVQADERQNIIAKAGYEKITQGLDQLSALQTDKINEAGTRLDRFTVAQGFAPTK